VVLRQARVCGKDSRHVPERYGQSSRAFEADDLWREQETGLVVCKMNVMDRRSAGDKEDHSHV